VTPAGTVAAAGCGGPGSTVAAGALAGRGDTGDTDPDALLDDTGGDRRGDDRGRGEAPRRRLPEFLANITIYSSNF